jgi:8-oxo-dGTP diphosphatase
MPNDASPEIPRTAKPEQWLRWEPNDRATLVFVIRDGEILLIRKKRGLGAGKINGPGGRTEPGESVLECACREFEEELCARPTGVTQLGELSFQFLDGYSIHVTVFTADGCDGEARETDEAVPQWIALDRIPYHEMWEDDRIWLPLLLAGDRFSGRFVFDGEAMLDGAVESWPGGSPEGG